MWGMVKRRQHLRFAAEASQSVRIEGEGGGQNLDGHVAPQLGIASAVHLAPPAQPKEGRRVEQSDSCADRKRQDAALARFRASDRAYFADAGRELQTVSSALNAVLVELASRLTSPSWHSGLGGRHGKTDSD